jgi:hypothetical protein
MLGRLGSDGGETIDYTGAVGAIDPNVAAGVTAAQAPQESWTQALLRVGPDLAKTLVTADAQRKLLDVQMQRAAQGLPPLNSSNYGLGVSVGLDPNMQRYLLLGGAALLMLLLLKRRA